MTHGFQIDDPKADPYSHPAIAEVLIHTLFFWRRGGQSLAELDWDAVNPVTKESIALASVVVSFELFLGL